MLGDSGRLSLAPLSIIFQVTTFTQWTGRSGLP